MPLLSVLFQRDLLGLDVGDEGVGVKCIAGSDDVYLISDGVLDDGFRSGLCICGDDGSKQAIRFYRTRRGPAEWSEDVVVYDRTFEGLGIEFGRGPGKTRRGTLRCRCLCRRLYRQNHKCCKHIRDPKTAGKCEKDNEDERQAR